MIPDINSITVTYHNVKVGTLTLDDKSCALFEYDAEWLAKGFSISPLHLPLKSGIFRAMWSPFGGNFGIFEDSLPGGYGELLFRKALAKQGINYDRLNLLQRLSLVGTNGMGALCYIPATEAITATASTDLERIQQMATEVLSEKNDEYAQLLFISSGNSGGARPKCLYNDKEGHWLVKFRHPLDPKNIGEIEYSYNQCAKKCGIEVPDFRLLHNKYFAVRRFDLDGNTRLHIATASALLNEPINPPKMDYLELLQFTGYLTQSPKAVEQQFRRMTFNIYTHNFDDHARNFSFICRNGEWILAPAYDLTNDQALGQHATTANYNGLPTDEDMIAVGTATQMKASRCKDILKEIREIINENNISELS